MRELLNHKSCGCFGTTEAHRWLASSWASIHHPHCLNYPRIRQNGQLERASGDKAMSLIVDKAQDLQSRLTNHSIGIYTSGRLFLQDYYALAIVSKAGLNTLYMYDA